MAYLQSALGLVVFTAFAWALSENRRAVSVRVALVGLALQLTVAFVLLRVPAARVFFVALGDAVNALEAATTAGTSFVFGYLGGAPTPFAETGIGASLVFAFRSLPLVIVVSALTALLTYWRVLPWIVGLFSFALRRTLGVSGAVSLSAAANIFVGMVEAPLFVRTYLAQMSRGELFMVMCTGMATIAGTVLVVYTTILGAVLPDAAGHLVTASIISAPAAIMVAWLMIPPDRPSESERTADLQGSPSTATSSMDAITQGTQQGLSLYLNIVAMLIVLVALVALVNAILGLGPRVGGSALTLEGLLGWLMAPVAWLMGVPWSESAAAGGLLGIKTVLNEFIAYTELARMPDAMIGERSRLIMTYALCGMANLGSVGIMIGGFTALVPERRREITGLALKSVVGGTIATCCTGAVVALVA